MSDLVLAIIEIFIRLKHVIFILFVPLLSIDVVIDLRVIILLIFFFLFLVQDLLVHFVGRIFVLLENHVLNLRAKERLHFAFSHTFGTGLESQSLGSCAPLGLLSLDVTKGCWVGGLV